MQLDCKTTTSINPPSLEEDIGLDMGDNGRIFVVSPESNALKVVSTNAATGGLGSVQTVPLGFGWRPTDVKAALGPKDEFTGLRKELIVVVGFDQTAGQGSVKVFGADLSFLRTIPIGNSGELISVVIREDGSQALAADPSTATVWTIDLNTLSQVDDQAHISGGGSVRRIGIQREEP